MTENEWLLLRASSGVVSGVLLGVAFLRLDRMPRGQESPLLLASVPLIGEVAWFVALIAGAPIDYRLLALCILLPAAGIAAISPPTPRRAPLHWTARAAVLLHLALGWRSPGSVLPTD